MNDAQFTTEVIRDFTIRIIVDDVSDNGTEFRASIYDEDLDLVGEGWSETTEQAIADAMENYLAN